MKRMRLLLPLVTISSLALAYVCAADGPASRPSTASAPTSQAAGWLTSYADAAKLAKETNKPILVDFTGSDWCVWCNRLKAEVFDKQEFKDWAAKNVVLLELDFPRNNQQDAETKKVNQDLLKKYDIKGFPTILLLKADGTSIGQTGYIKGGPKPWLEKADSILAAPATETPKP